MSHGFLATSTIPSHVWDGSPQRALAKGISVSAFDDNNFAEITRCIWARIPAREAGGFIMFHRFGRQRANNSNMISSLYLHLRIDYSMY